MQTPEQDKGAGPPSNGLGLAHEPLHLDEGDRATLDAVRLCLAEEHYPNEWEHHLDKLIASGLVQITHIGELRLLVCTPSGLSIAYRRRKT